jgi:hypothetical protein
MQVWKRGAQREEALSEVRVGLGDRRRTPVEGRQGTGRRRAKTNDQVPSCNTGTVGPGRCCNVQVSRLRFDARRLLEGYESRIADPLPDRAQTAE